MGASLLPFASAINDGGQGGSLGYRSRLGKGMQANRGSGPHEKIIRQLNASRATIEHGTGENNPQQKKKHGRSSRGESDTTLRDVLGMLAEAETGRHRLRSSIRKDGRSLLLKVSLKVRAQSRYRKGNWVF